ncbi:MAG: hypothetical protein Q9P44_17010 [Anaerolineae bacterium]|nr:hypothetical protein [Anaerolineae bacterium]
MHETQVHKLTILYTANLRGDLQVLPRLYTYLQKLKSETENPVLLLDLGHSCVADVWHCDVTEGRSTLVVLDGMGYHAANVADFLEASQRDKLRNSMTTGMVDVHHSWRYHVPPVRDETIIISAIETPALSLCIVAAPATKTQFNSRTLWLQGVDKGQVGFVEINVPALKIYSHAILDIPSGLKVDATIAAAVEFVEEEAQFLRKNQS